jgi:AcrR family transcriptional regulator
MAASRTATHRRRSAPSSRTRPDGQTWLRERHRRRTMDAIIDAARELFEHDGYDAVSVEGIAAAVEPHARVVTCAVRLDVASWIRARRREL